MITRLLAEAAAAPGFMGLRPKPPLENQALFPDLSLLKELALWIDEKFSSGDRV